MKRIKPLIEHPYLLSSLRLGLLSKEILVVFVLEIYCSENLNISIHSSLRRVPQTVVLANLESSSILCIAMPQKLSLHSPSFPLFFLILFLVVSFSLLVLYMFSNFPFVQKKSPLNVQTSTLKSLLTL